jgi:hypothetical protein
LRSWTKIFDLSELKMCIVAYRHDGPSIPLRTPWQPSLVPLGWYETVWQQQIWCHNMAKNNMSFGSGLRSWTKIFDLLSELKMCHCLALMGHSYLSGHYTTHPWSLKGDMKLFGSNRYGVMAQNNVILAQVLVLGHKPKFLTIWAQNVSWLGTDGPSIPLRTPYDAHHWFI